jgi:hypothetical protein
VDKRLSSAIFSALLLAAAVAAAPPAAPPKNWPPKIGQPYPDIEVLDAEGNKVRLSSFKGKVILLEPVGMTCAACNAFSGANKKEVGHFAGIQPQGGLPDIEEMLPQYAHVKLGDPRFEFVQLLLYNLSMKGPTPSDAKRWAKHYRASRYKNWHVLAGGDALVNPGSYGMIPGFQVIDKDFILRWDATGDYPKQSVWNDALPGLAKLIRDAH